MTDFLEKLAAILGPKGIATEAGDIAPYLAEERGLYKGSCMAVARPASTGEVAAVVGLCAESGIGIVPQGGNTGLCGGAVPAGNQIVLSLARLNRIRDIDPTDYTMTVEAGVILTSIQQAAEERDCLFPLSLGAEGSCQIGGNISTNAGGVNVVRYGNTRDLVLGIEAVLPDGSIWNGLRRLRKDNTGYDLKQLFIGGEGTLGIVTAAVLKLFPKPREIETAFVAVENLDDVLTLLQRTRAASGDSVVAFELIPRIAVEMAARHVHGVIDPLQQPYPHYVLMEFASSRPEGGLRASMEKLLETAFEDGLVVDAVIAESIDQRRAFWRLRE
ncbi:MAG: FAD-binding oxidoreductase, partial [Rhodospirillales bacterium]|nr:FAD-binding oxidoreductase [Rhodospirillales bacterium]